MYEITSIPATRWNGINEGPISGESNCVWEPVYPALEERYGTIDLSSAPYQLELEGGTKGEYCSKEWAESVNFWQKYAVLETPENV